MRLAMSSLSRSVPALAAAILVAGLAGASVQVAPQAPGQATQQGADIQKPLSPAQVQAMIDGYVIVQAERALNLTDAQFPQFVSHAQPAKLRGGTPGIARDHGT